MISQYFRKRFPVRENEVKLADSGKRIKKNQCPGSEGNENVVQTDELDKDRGAIVLVNSRKRSTSAPEEDEEKNTKKVKASKTEPDSKDITGVVKRDNNYTKGEDGTLSDLCMPNLYAIIGKESRPIFREIRGDNLDLQYCRLFSRSAADYLLKILELSLEYDACSRVKIFGKTFDVPRKQTAFGDVGLAYTFSGVTVPAKSWIPCLTSIKNHVEKCSGCKFNFVLINRYENGEHYMGEHRDDEKDLVAGYPIASLSLGQPRDFVFRHKDSRGAKRTGNHEPVKLLLEHGSLLLMNHPTNVYWYHCLPKRAIAKAPLPRINLTFRQMVLK